MKRFTVVLLALLYFLTANMCFAFGELYFIKNAQQKDVATTVEDVLNHYKYQKIKSNPFYAKSAKDDEDYAAIILQQSGDNLFYYYSSNDGNRSFNKKFLSAFRKLDLDYEKSENEKYLTHFDSTAKKLVSGTQTAYTFNAPQTVPTSHITTKSSNTLKGFVAKIPKDTAVGVYLQTPINTATAAKHDKITGVLMNDWKFNDLLVAPQGSIVNGHLSKANAAKYMSRNGSVTIEFTSLTTPTNKTYKLSTDPIKFTVSNEGKLESTVIKVIKWAAIAAITGLIIAAACGGSGGKSSAIAAGAGAGVALMTSVSQKGIDAEIPSFTELELVLKNSLNAVLSY